MDNTERTADSIITANPLPAILIGGPPKAGKSVLTYNLTRELRRYDIPHYVFRANPDIEGDWYLKGDLETVDQIVGKVRAYRKWTDIFRAFVCRDLAHRHLPLIVDLGGLPNDADTCIFQVCTHSILLLKDEKPETTPTWLRYTKQHGLTPIAELHSKQQGESTLTAENPIITGTITGLEPGARIHNSAFDALLERVKQLFGSYSAAELEQFHVETAPLECVVHLPQRLHTFAPDTDEWSADMLAPLLRDLPPQTAMAVYGRAPNWVYSALAIHAGTQLFHQFDARLGWVTAPALRASTAEQVKQPFMFIEPEHYNDTFVVLIHPTYNYLDHRDASELMFPEPPPQHGVIVTGKLPLWLFTALARFYAQRDVPWIALNDAHDNRPVVIYSQVASHPIGQILPELH